ncbi:MAG: alpha-amylase, partial [Chitinophagaceae bacterium]
MNGVLFQGFHWFLATNFPGSQNRNLWQFLADEADHLRAIGITAVWIPPAYWGANRTGVGYDVYDHYNIGEFPAHGDANVATRYGTKADLKAAVTALHGNGQNQPISVYADIVLNHKTGGDESDGF